MKPFYTPPNPIYFILLFLIIVTVPKLLFPSIILYVILKNSGILRKVENFFREIKNGSTWSNVKSNFTSNKDTINTKSNPNNPNYFSTMEQFNFKKSYVLYFAIFFGFALMIIDGLVSVPPGHVAVIYDRGIGVLEESYPPGLHFKIPFWQVSQLMDTRLQTYTMSIAPKEGQQMGDDSIESLTQDGQTVLVDITIQYLIDPQDASWMYNQIGVDYIEKVVRPGVRNVARDVITGYDSTKLFTQKTRTEAQKLMKDKLKVLYAKNRVNLDDLLLRNIKFSDAYLQAIEAKQVAQQKIQKAEYERQEAEKIKEKKIIEAEAEAEAIRLKGEMLKKNPQVIQFEFVQKVSPDVKWGILPDNIIPMMDFNGFTSK